ncbi:hypothetical protein K2173_020679 [Erythroxylum novogranatense]|uniref:C2 NT-type domain-containing protein n=1 Tax=Erythroxylum novogranatense TaxID=1862640 RepID=A0AAV8TNL0_9ROSI|nr:hypothetical protein K2173_020679 [Erythroxylum novogranatense]
MVLGPGAKGRKRGSVQVNYLIHIQEIKPWPPSQSLKSLRSVLIQWESGGRYSGSTNTVVPSLGSIAGDGKIEFNESFKLPVTLTRKIPAKGKGGEAFQKNVVEFNLCEPRRDKMQLLATAIIDLADYGVIEETMSISVPMNSNRSFRNSSGPMLYVNVQRVGKGHASPSLKDNLAKVGSLDENGGELVSTLMNEEHVEEAEVSSFTDDDVSSHSSLTNGSLPSKNAENGPDSLLEKKGRVSKDHNIGQKLGCEENLAPPENSDEVQCVRSSSSHYTYEDTREEDNTSTIDGRHLDLELEAQEKVPSFKSITEFNAEHNSKHNASSYFSDEYENPLKASTHSSISYDLPVNEKDRGKYQGAENCSLEDNTEGSTPVYSTKNMIEKEHWENENKTSDLEEEKVSLDNEPVHNFAQVSTIYDGSIESDSHFSITVAGMEEKHPKIDRLKHVKSVRSPPDSVRSSRIISRNQHNEVKEVTATADADNSARNAILNDQKNAKVYPINTTSTHMENRIQQLENKIKMLEGELRETAAIEAALYSVAAEHGSSMSKVHAPARRLSRLYLHACGEGSQIRQASAARSAVSGLVLVAKACGNHVPRLTFWLSNCVVMRAIICQAISDQELKHPATPYMDKNVGAEGKSVKSTSLKWKTSASQTNKNDSYGDLVEWEDPHKLVSCLERVEAWIFTRIVESIWWQTLAPNMQSAATMNNLGRTSNPGDEDQVNFSQDLWEKAFKDACERLCPVRAGGHECGCLLALARLIMDQCMARLDVAMFNAILRESADTIPTDPVSDPISDPKVLPIPAGRSSFGAGAQLKNVIGSWSRWLTDVFGMNDDGLVDEEKDEDNKSEDTSFKSFHLLNALSDLMMLPKDMLLSKSVREEVCPQFGAQVIKRVLDAFVTDDFCPDPIPDIVLEALDSVDTPDAVEDFITTIPCTAAPTIYLPPSATSIAATIGESGGQHQLRRSGSSVARKSYTSDDELDELNSPLTSIFNDNSQPAKLKWKSKEIGYQNAVRYELLREIWMKSE